MDWKRSITRGVTYTALGALAFGSAWGIRHISFDWPEKDRELREVTGMVKISLDSRYNFELTSSDGTYLFNTRSSDVFKKYEFPIRATITTDARPGRNRKALIGFIPPEDIECEDEKSN